MSKQTIDPSPATLTATTTISADTTAFRRVGTEPTSTEKHQVSPSVMKVVCVGDSGGVQWMRKIEAEYVAHSERGNRGGNMRGEVS